MTRKSLSGGKTYSMFGPGYDGLALEDDAKALRDPGLVPRIVRALFAQIADRESSDENVEFHLRTTYVEIYKETIRDVLAPRLDRRDDSNRCSLKIQHDSLRGLWLPEATQVPVHNVLDVMAVLRVGNRNRAVAKTNWNEHSSRSHALLILTVEARHRNTQITNMSHLYLVDLAGSEQVSKTGASGERLKEAQSINQSLSALGLVIYALSSLKNAKSKKVFVPYRNSKLTRLLQNCIGGNARTTLLINCSPSSVCASETLSTLRFGERTQMIKNQPKVNIELSYAELKAMFKAAELTISKQKAVIAQLESEVKVLQKLGLFQERTQEAPPAVTSIPAGLLPADDTDRPSTSSSLVAMPLVTRSPSPSHYDHGGRAGRGMGRGWTPEPEERKEVTAQLATGTGAGESREGKRVAWGEEPRAPAAPSPPFAENLETLGLGRPSHHKLPDTRELLVHFICPLSKYVMTDPVIALDGFTYDRRAIEAHMARHRESPMTGRKLGGKLLIPNVNLQQQIRKCYPQPVPNLRLSGFHMIARPVLRVLLSYLDARSICRLQQTCEELRQAADDEKVWKGLIRNSLGVEQPELKDPTPTYKAFYILRRPKRSQTAMDTERFPVHSKAVIGQVVVEVGKGK